MSNNTTVKAISLATVIAVTISLSSTAFAHDPSRTGENLTTIEKQHEISKRNARNLVKTLLKRDYKGENYIAGSARKVDDKWVVTIRDRLKTVATASVDAKTGNIHVQ